MEESGRTVLWVLVTRNRIRAHRDFSAAYERAAAELEHRGREVACAPQPRQYARWLKAGGVKTAPHSATAVVLEHMFQRPVQDLLAPADALTEHGRHPAPVVPPVPVLDESDLEMTARDAAAHAGDAAALSLPEMSLDQLHDDLTSLARTFERTSPAEVYQRAQELLNIAQAMLERTRVPRQQTRAYLAAGQAAALLSAVSFDVGALTAATQLARTAAMYGLVIEHGPLQAYAHGALAFLAFWDGRPSQAVRLVQQGQQYGGLGDTARRRLLVIEARAHGHLGNAEEAERVIRTALEQDSGVRDELHDDIGGEFGFPAARTAMSNATTYLLVRDADGAEQAAGHALDLLSTQPPERRPVLVSGPAAIDLARARLVRQDLDGAQEALEPVFTIPAPWRGAGMLERLTAARAELTGPRLRG
ncbi:hypothetical protein, partial [Streptomyces sp. NPDC048845]|uniref:hypothetical protein n=1 Tax=Streptomyces sp. NPDC048845 TaxID=3155390 RepID=UPI0034233C71